MWQDLRLAVNHEHAPEFVSTILDAPGAQAPKQSEPQCQPQAQQKAGEMGRQLARINGEGMFLEDVQIFTITIFTVP